ncbi:hypothetical protein ACM614_14965 [Streptomyces sp. 12297]
MSRVTVPDVAPLDPAFTDYVAAQADNHADAEGWSLGLRERVQQSLYLLTAVHGPHETIKASTVATLPRQRSRRAVLRVAEVLATLELLNDDRPDPLDKWIHRRLTDRFRMRFVDGGGVRPALQPTPGRDAGAAHGLGPDIAPGTPVGEAYMMLPSAARDGSSVSGAGCGNGATCTYRPPRRTSTHPVT